MSGLLGLLPKSIINKLRNFEKKYPFIYRLIFRVLFAFLCLVLSGGSYISLDGDGSSDEGDSPKSKGETSSTSTKATKDVSTSDVSKANSGDDINPIKTTKDVSQDVSSPDAGKDHYEADASKKEDLPKKNSSLHDAFARMYLQMHEHENNLLNQEKEEYNKTGVLPEENYHERMAETRKNDQINLAKHLKSSDTSESGTSSLENKRDHEGDHDSSETKKRKE